MNRGAVNASELVAAAALETFSGFSDMVAGIGDELPRIIGRSALFAPFELILAGFSTKRAEPQCWFIQTPGSPSGPGYPQPYRIQRFPNVMVGPTPSSEIQAAAGYELISENAEPDAVVPCLGQILEMQRHSKFDGLHWVGGFGELTTLTPDNIEQRRLQLWPEDRVGERIQPKAIEWSEWKCM
jgi:hypothetical protein